MTEKEFLSRAYLLDQQINSKLEQLSSLRELALKCTSSNDGECVSGSPNHTKMQDIITKIMDMETEINVDIEKLVDIKREINHSIANLENPIHKLLLEQRYILCKPWEDVADYIGFEINSIYKMHKRILKNFQSVQLNPLKSTIKV